MNDITTWIAADRPDNPLPASARTTPQSFDGTVYVPAALAGSETLAVVCAAREGETLVRYLGHAYLRGDWMRSEFPEHADTVDALGSRFVDAVFARHAIALAPPASSEATSP